MTSVFRILTCCLTILLVACGRGDTAADPEAAAPVIATTDTATTALLAALPKTDDPASATFQTLDGRGFDIDVFAGKKVFVNFWATWCAPCIREIPSLNRAADMLTPEGYVFLFASDEAIDTIDSFLAERQFPGHFVKLNGYFASYDIGAVPSSWLLDENGDLVDSWAGAYEWDSPEMLEQIRN